MSEPGIHQSVLSPAGVHASSIHTLWLLMLTVCVAVYVTVLTATIVAVLRGSANAHADEPAAPAEATLAKSVYTGIGLTSLILVGLLVASVATGRAVAARHPSNVVSIAVTGHQWWWEIQYEDGIANRRVTTANELRIPANRPVVLKVTSRDVIHSFWVPNLQGKRDLIPGYTTAIAFQADAPGVFRGQCAEFCGMQHAHMALDVVAQPTQDFEAWLDAARQPAREPTEPGPRRGRDVFMQASCATCHTVRGTGAGGLVGPDLTHVASRRTLGAGTLPNTPDALTSWIRDPQRFKPGTQMPASPLPRGDLEALVTWLGTLQ